MTSYGSTALVVVDVQNDFCAGPLAIARYPGDPAELAGVVANTARAVALARERDTEVVFVRFVGDPVHQRASWRRRDAARGRPPKCLEGTWGAEFPAGLGPAPGEQVFTKRACFDAFLAEGFERHLRERGVEHLALAGLFADVCVDTTARTAFQKGFHVTVLQDCTAALHTPLDQTLRFMSRVYGARVTGHDEAAVWTRSAEEPDRRTAEDNGPVAVKAAVMKGDRAP
ncbi:isochorismatase family cysteine hydrolase [Streptomyces sp. NPDC026672]|uniref:cysteine hydrolase family protein n=1 Tax=unclassified Streptomyces TaxID=2593676 RepID=UPI0033C2C9F1